MSQPWVKTITPGRLQAQTKKAGEEIEAQLQQQDLKGAWSTLKAWYQHSGDRPPKPLRQDLKSLTNKREVLYTHVPSPGAPIPIHVNPFPIQDEIPSEDEIAVAVTRLKKGKAPGPLGLWADDIH